MSERECVCVSDCVCVCVCVREREKERERERGVKVVGWSGKDERGIECGNERHCVCAFGPP